MTHATRILKVDHEKISARRVTIGELSERTQQRFAASDFEPLRLPISNPQRTDSQRDARVESALTALNAAIQQLQAQRDHWLDQCQAETIRLGVAIAERLLRRTLTTDPEAVMTWFALRSTGPWARIT